MKKKVVFQWLFVCLLAVALPCGAAPSVDEAKKALEGVLRQEEYAFTPSVKKAYLDYTEAVIRAKYGPNKINEKTWKWIHQRPQILSAVAAAESPVNPNILLNFQRIGLALGPERLTQWCQLALAYAIRHREEPFPLDNAKEEWDPMRLERLVSESRKGRGGSFALLEEDDFPEVSEEEKRLGEWIAGPQSLGSTRPPMTIADLMEMPIHEINMMTRKKPDDPPMITKFPNWDNVAYGGKIFPPYVDGTPTPQRAVLMKIFRNGRIPAKSDRPPFRMEKSDWPILLYVADLAEIDETSFIFNYFVSNKKLPPLGLGQKANSSGSTDADMKDPNSYYARSNWHPKKMIRLYNGSKKDQGGKSWAWGLNAVNVAATPVAAPPDGKFYFMGERGNYTYFMSCADNAFTGLGSSAPWYLPKAESLNPAQPHTGSVQHNIFMGLSTTLNQGLQQYEDARIVLAIIDLMKPSTPRRIALLESAFLQNPLNGDVIYRLAAAYRQTESVDGMIRMLTAIRAYAQIGLKLPVSPTAAKTARAAAAKYFKAKEPSYRGLQTVSVNQSPWLFLICSEVATAYLRESNGKGKEALRDELAYEQMAAEGCGDKPIVRALETLQELVR